jgi:hypothetical protein
LISNNIKKKNEDQSSELNKEFDNLYNWIKKATYGEFIGLEK